MLLRWLCSPRAGHQEDAAEHLGNLLTMTGMDAELGVRQSDAQLVLAGELVCKTPARAEVSELAAPVDMHSVVQDAVRAQGLQTTPKLFIICLANTYEQGEESFWVTARANWTPEAMELELAPDNAPSAKYRLRGYVQHKHGDIQPSNGMQSGHYVAYLCKQLPARRGTPRLPKETVWLEADDHRVRRMSSPPDVYPYLIFYELVGGDRVHVEERIRNSKPKPLEPELLAMTAPQPENDM